MQNINKFQVKCPTPVMVSGGLCDDTTERAWPGSVNMEKIIYVKGEIVGCCIYIMDAPAYINTSGKKSRCAIFECRCGVKFQARIDSAKAKHTTSCGCIHDGNLKTHGLSKYSYYRPWVNMIARCYNTKSNRYKYYGGRGITVCDEWQTDFKAYYDYIMSLENAMQPGLTIDRIKNNEGYKPGNLRWASSHTQMANRGVMVSNTSGYTGVSYAIGNQKWYAYITIHKKRTWLGHYDTANEAAIARDQYIIINNLTEYKLNLNQ